MICVHKNKVSDAPEHNFTVARCDGCKMECPESKLPGRVGFKSSDDAEKAALAVGWVEANAQEKRGRRYVTVVNLYCPDCIRKAAGLPTEATPP